MTTLEQPLTDEEIKNIRSRSPRLTAEEFREALRRPSDLTDDELIEFVKRLATLSDEQIQELIKPTRLSDEEIRVLIKSPLLRPSRRLEKLTQQENADLEKNKRMSDLVNLSITELAQNLSNTFNDVLTDLLSGNISLDTFIGNNRLIYIGIFMILLSLFVMLINSGKE